MRDSDRKANAAALFARGDTVAKANAKKRNGEPLSLPCTDVGGALVFTYAENGILCMPLRISVGDTTVYEVMATHYGRSGIACGRKLSDLPEPLKITDQPFTVTCPACVAVIKRAV